MVNRNDFRLQCVRCGRIQTAGDDACEACGCTHLRKVSEY